MSDAAEIPSEQTPSSDGADVTPHNKPLLDFLTGGAMGLLVGALIGLSTVPVVGGLVSALTALVGAFLGLAAPTSTRMAFSLRAWRIVGFGLVSVLAIVAGIYLRTNQILQPSIKDQVNALIDAKFDPMVAQELIAYRDFGIVPGGKTVQMNEVQRGGIGALFDTQASVCNQLVRAHNSSTADRLRALSAGGDYFAKMADRISHADLASQNQLLDSAQTILCGS
ncbi:hypothetical protein J4761_19695 [Burkholderia pseudomallei]|uniref:hypothetical protein n=1 Tax=Burkholderia pseudomallei TaxID=28450 RepID=UPI001AB00E57|nr:hypothetical protein [Burkholderia pseudomallei]MBO2962253.1 hypothetical protein [Burkholderia pseudomallei]MBO7788227.1 hypothetical protein [Burkholderia pseudomallei]MBO7841634.1 hypothetical protein [Burkholderia pseudomallei]